MVHMYIGTNTTIFLIVRFTITKVQLHVSAIKFGHLQVVHEASYDKLYLHLSGGTVCGVDSVDIAYRKVFHVQPEDGQH